MTDGFIGLLYHDMRARLHHMWMNWGRRKSFMFQHIFRITFLAFLRHNNNNTTMNFFSSRFRLYVSRHITCSNRAFINLQCQTVLSFFFFRCLKQKSHRSEFLLRNNFSPSSCELWPREKSCLVSFLRSFFHSIHCFHCCWQIECEVEELKCNIAEHRESAESQNQKN